MCVVCARVVCIKSSSNRCVYDGSIPFDNSNSWAYIDYLLGFNVFTNNNATGNKIRFKSIYLWVWWLCIRWDNNYRRHSRARRWRRQQRQPRSSSYPWLVGTGNRNNSRRDRELQWYQKNAFRRIIHSSDAFFWIWMDCAFSHAQSTLLFLQMETNNNKQYWKTPRKTSHKTETCFYLTIYLRISPYRFVRCRMPVFMRVCVRSTLAECIFCLLLLLE